MINTEKITSVELMDNMPTGTHKVIIDTYEEEKYDDYTYLNFQLVGIEGDLVGNNEDIGVLADERIEPEGSHAAGHAQADVPGLPHLLGIGLDRLAHG